MLFLSGEVAPGAECAGPAPVPGHAAAVLLRAAAGAGDQLQRRGGHGGGAGAALGRLAVRLTHRAERAELLVKILRGENIPINYRTQTASTSVKLAILPSKLAKVGLKTT